MFAKRSIERLAGAFLVIGLVAFLAQFSPACSSAWQVALRRRACSRR